VEGLHIVGDQLCVPLHVVYDICVIFMGISYVCYMYMFTVISA
jgi:hypothetical protein